MKKPLLPALLLIMLGIGAVWAVLFYRANLRGIAPAVFKASSDAAALVRQENSPLSYPAEFKLTVFMDGLPGCRVITFDAQDTMLVSIPSQGKVVALPDSDSDGRADKIIEVISGLNRPHGLAFAGNAGRRLYIAEQDKVSAYDYNPAQRQATNAAKIADLPGSGGHSSRTLLFMPPPDEDNLLISVGSSCNACLEKDWRRAKILVVNKNGGPLQTFASGLRNAVFMRAHPTTTDIWATEMGRDYLGDDLPPDEINIIKRSNDYGWPYCYGKNVLDKEYAAADNFSRNCADKIPSFIDIQAHSAPLGLDFFPASGWPAHYRNTMLVAYHGSWNRTIPTGYKIVLFRFNDQGELVNQHDFMSGWLTDDKKSAIGRPVDISIKPRGLIYISDDKAGVIYRLSLAAGNNQD